MILKQKLSKKIFNINIFDVFVLLIVCFGVIFIVKKFQRKDQWRTIRIQVADPDGWSGYENRGSMFWLARGLEKGLVEKSSDGEVIAEILEVQDYERGNEKRDLYLIIKVKGFLNKTKNQFVFKSRFLGVASLVEFYFDKVHVLGWVVDEKWDSSDMDLTTFEVKARWENVYPWQAEALKKGLVMNGFGDKQIAELKSFRIENADLVTTDSLGQVYLRKNPSKRDVYLTFKLSAEKYGDEYYFAGHQKVKVGESLWVYFENVDLESIRVSSVDVWRE